MDSEQTTPMPPDSKQEKAGSKLAWAIAFVMTLAAGSFGYLYFTKSAPESQPQTEQNQNTEDTEESARTIYQAEIGKFSINLPNEYGVVESLDGNFEGGPSTVLEIGETNNSIPNIIATNPSQPFQIIAKPQVGATLDENDIIGALTSKPAIDQTNNIEFAGVPARSYDYNELFDTKSIIFIKNDIVYHIALLREDQTQADMLQAVEAGWEFVE